MNKSECIYNDETPLYNIRILRSYIDYVVINYPKVNIDEVLKYAGVTKLQYNDFWYWCNQRQMDRLQDFLIKKTSNYNLSRYVGRNLTISQNFIALYVLGFFNLLKLNKQVARLYNKLSKYVVVKINNIADNKCEYITVPVPGVKEKPYQCRNRIGSIEGVLKNFLGRFPQIEHPECYHQGANHCRYVVSWDKLSKSNLFENTRNHSVAIGSILTLVAIIFLPIKYALLTALFSLSVVMYLTQHSFRLEKDKCRKISLR